jgi:hypothetical protein
MFLDCAPAYFEYMSKAFFHGLSVLPLSPTPCRNHTSLSRLYFPCAFHTQTDRIVQNRWSVPNRFSQSRNGETEHGPSRGDAEYVLQEKDFHDL